MEILSAAQCRAARALLNWSQPELAANCDVHVQTISAFENENSTPTKTTLQKISEALENAGIELLINDGVGRRVNKVKTYNGISGFEAFIWDVYETVRIHNGKICVSNVDEKIFDANLSWKTDSEYIRKMTKLKETKNFSFRVLVQEGDTYFPSSEYAEYRWIEKKYFRTIPFYVYGDKLAIINFDQKPTVHVVENKDIANAQRVQFDILWDNSKIPPNK